MPYFDDSAARRVCNFFERRLILPETGRPFVLEAWEREFLSKVFGQKNDDGTRLIRTAYLEIPKKNGKSALLSGIAIYLLCADGEPSAEVYSAAADRAQASIVFNSAKQMVLASKKLLGVVRPYRYTLVCESAQGTYAPISADAYTKEGLKASGILFDELHAQPDRRLWDTLRGSGLARPQPLCVVATTAGADQTGIGWEVHEYACRVRDGQIIDPTFFPLIYGASADDDDADDPATWRRCNPSLNVTITERDFAARHAEAKSSGPAAYAAWKRYHLNIWQTSLTAWLPMDRWEKCGEKPLNANALKGKTCFPGADLSSITDLTSLSLLFSAGVFGAPQSDALFIAYDLLVFSWMPRGRVMAAEQRDRVPYRAWAAQTYPGCDQPLLELTDGDAIDQRLIFKRVKALHDLFPFHGRQLRLDDYNAPQFIQDLSAEGFTPVPVSPRAKGISPPSKELLRLVTDCQIYHGRNPLLTWQAAQCDVAEDTEGNIRPSKGRGEARKRIDGILSTVYALSGAMVHARAAATITKSVYDQRGIMFL